MKILTPPLHNFTEKQRDASDRIWTQGSIIRVHSKPHFETTFCTLTKLSKITKSNLLYPPPKQYPLNQGFTRCSINNRPLLKILRRLQSIRELNTDRFEHKHGRTTRLEHPECVSVNYHEEIIVEASVGPQRRGITRSQHVNKRTSYPNLAQRSSEFFIVFQKQTVEITPLPPPREESNRYKPTCTAGHQSTAGFWNYLAVRRADCVCPHHNTGVSCTVYPTLVIHTDTNRYKPTCTAGHQSTAGFWNYLAVRRADCVCPHHNTGVSCTVYPTLVIHTDTNRYKPTCTAGHQSTAGFWNYLAVRRADCVCPHHNTGVSCTVYPTLVIHTDTNRYKPTCTAGHQSTAGFWNYLAVRRADCVCPHHNTGVSCTVYPTLVIHTDTIRYKPTCTYSTRLAAGHQSTAGFWNYLAVRRADCVCPHHNTGVSCTVYPTLVIHTDTNRYKPTCTAGHQSTAGFWNYLAVRRADCVCPHHNTGPSYPRVKTIIFVDNCMLCTPTTNFGLLHAKPPVVFTLKTMKSINLPPVRAVTTFVRSINHFPPSIREATTLLICGKQHHLPSSSVLGLLQTTPTGVLGSQEHEVSQRATFRRGNTTICVFNNTLNTTTSFLVLLLPTPPLLFRSQDKNGRLSVKQQLHLFSQQHSQCQRPPSQVDTGKASLGVRLQENEVPFHLLDDNTICVVNCNLNAVFHN
ncbi:hypothetical protein J6590_003757 [Homalodisca vitripennis]|nr:hypothetical protein J6590_003757 [Homalodisca vitripennis]